MNLLARVAQKALNQGFNFRFKHFVHWTPGITRAYRQVENAAFRQELRYCGRELRERADFAGFEGLVLFDPKKPAAVMMVYHGTGSDSIYLDTLAVSSPGGGLGSVLIKNLIEEAGNSGFSSMEIDTEMFSERGHELVGFYQRFGFQITSRDEKTGNISMVLQLHPKR